EIRRLNADLELRVDERTRQLMSTNVQLGDEVKQRIEVQDRLKEEHNLISTILNNANALIIVLDREDRIIIFNQFCETLTGLKSQDVKGKNFFDLNLIPSEELLPFQEYYFEFKKTSNATKFYYENSWIGEDKKNHLIGWSVAAINGINSTMEFMVFLGLDLTENRYLRASLGTSEEKYRNLFLNLPISTLEVAYENDALVIVNANYQALQTYGDLVSLNPTSFLERIFAPGRKQDVETIKKQSNRLARLAFESSHIRANGETFPVRINISFDSVLSFSHYVLMIEDITAEKMSRSEELAISEERSRMAKEIHDGIAQDLVTLKMRSYSWKELIARAPQKLTAEIEFLQTVLDNDIQEVRRSIFDLRPLSLEKEGFFPSITRFFKDFGELNKMNTHLSLCDDLPPLAEELELSTFRMIQESLYNVAKHSKAHNVWISFRKTEDGWFTLEIRDDGVGLNIQDIKAMQHQGHFGLSQLQGRVLKNHGKLEIASEPNKGVAIHISLPIREKLA
ncbi:MAG TPA: PAS domain S-box protein, partial [Leptolinea sp.]